jgi:hypothetical protein
MASFVIVVRRLLTGSLNFKSIYFLIGLIERCSVRMPDGYLTSQEVLDNISQSAEKGHIVLSENLVISPETHYQLTDLKCAENISLFKCLKIISLQNFLNCRAHRVDDIDEPGFRRLSSLLSTWLSSFEQNESESNPVYRIERGNTSWVWIKIRETASFSQK